MEELLSYEVDLVSGAARLTETTGFTQHPRFIFSQSNASAGVTDLFLNMLSKRVRALW